MYQTVGKPVIYIVFLLSVDTLRVFITLCPPVLFIELLELTEALLGARCESEKGWNEITRIFKGKQMATTL